MTPSISSSLPGHALLGTVVLCNRLAHGGKCCSVRRAPVMIVHESVCWIIMLDWVLARVKADWPP